MTMHEVSPPAIGASSVGRSSEASTAALQTLSRYDCRIKIASQ